MNENEKPISTESNLTKIRCNQRENQQVVREQKKDFILKQKRIQLSEVEDQFKYISAEEVKDLALKLKKSGDSLNVLRDIKRAACSGEECIESFLKVDGALYALIGIFTGNDAEKQLEATACLTNLATGSHKSTYRIAKVAGAYLVSYLPSGSHFLQNQCAWAVGNIANDCQTCFSFLKAQGLLPTLLSLLQSPFPEVIQSVTFALHACTKYEDSDISDMVKQDLPESLLQLLKRDDLSHRALVDAMFALSNICCKIIQYKAENIQQQFGSAILNYLNHVTVNENFDVLLATPLVRCLGNLTSGSNALCKFILQHETFSNCLRRIFSSQYHHIKKEILWVLSNLLVSTGSSKYSLDVDFVVQNIKIFLNPLDSAVVQALYFLCILMSKEEDYCQLFINNGLLARIEPLSNCGKEDIECATRTFCNMVQAGTEHQ